MKKLITALCCLGFAHFAEAQLNNTSWTGTVDAGGELEVRWTLKNDTSYFYGVNDGALLDMSSFTIKDSVISLKKISGVTACDATVATYKFSIKDKTLRLEMVQDNCFERSGPLDKAEFTRKED